MCGIACAVEYQLDHAHEILDIAREIVADVVGTFKLTPWLFHTYLPSSTMTYDLAPARCLPFLLHSKAIYTDTKP